MYLMRTHGVDTLKKPAENDKRVLQAQWSSRYQRASELASHQTPEELHGFDAGTAQAVHEARNRMRPTLHARERLPALLRTTLLLSQVRGEHQKEIDKRRGETADAMEFDDKGRMICKKATDGKRGTSRPSKRATINPNPIQGRNTSDDSGRKSGIGAAGKGVAAAAMFAEGADGEKKMPKLRRNASAFDVNEETTKPEKTARERAPSMRRVTMKATPRQSADMAAASADAGASSCMEASTDAARATMGAYLEPSEPTPAKEPSKEKKPAGLGLSLNLAAAPPGGSVTNI